MAGPSEKPVAIITGSGSGIGAACASSLAGSGFEIVVNFSQNAGGAENTASDCLRLGAQTLIVQADIRDDLACRSMIDQALRRFGRLDALVNNAGVTRFVDQQNLEGLSGDDFNHIFSTNVTANYQMIRAAVTALRGAPNPSIVNISSNSGVTGMGSSMAYAASKGALNTMTLSMARTLAPDIRVNAVCPGFVDTSWWKAKLSDEELDQLRNEAMKYLPLNRVVTAEDVADAVSWLICGARTVTGQLLTLDSGAHLTAVRS